MNQLYVDYLEAMKARHAADLAALAGRKGAVARRALAALTRRYAALERETEAILAEIDGREPGMEDQHECL